MTKYSRRTFGKIALAAAPLARGSAAINSTFGGVRIGICSFSFRGFKLDDIVSQMMAVSIGELELESLFVEPAANTLPGALADAPAGGRGALSPEQRNALRRWRLSVPLDEFQAVRKKFGDSGINIYAYNIPFNDTFTEEEIDRVFQMAAALGVRIVNAVTTLRLAPRLVAPSAKYQMRVGFHPTGGGGRGAAPNPDAIGAPESWRKVVALAPNFGVNPDLGALATGVPDPLAFLREMHDRLTTIHTHERRTEAPAGPAKFGEGNMPIREILLMIRKEKYTFVPMIERTSHPDGTANVDDLRASVEYCKGVLL